MNIDAAGIFIINKKGKVLVIHRKDFLPEGNKWGIPGGGVKDNVTPLETAIIKTKQEVGVSVNKETLKFLDDFKYRVNDNVIKFSVWVYKYNLENEGVVLNPEGHDDYIWEKPEILINRKNLMFGMYPILNKFLHKT